MNMPPRYPTCRARLIPLFGLLIALPAAGFGAAKTISVDGDPSDWDPADVLYSDAEISDGDPAASSYSTVYVANDDVSLYFGLETKGSGGGDIYNPWTHYIYLDTDENPATGYNAGAWAGGYDHQVLYGDNAFEENLYEFAGSSQGDDNWSYLVFCANASSDSFIEIAVPLDRLGLTVGDTTRILLIVDGVGITVETQAHSAEASSKSYTLAEPVPPTSRTIIVDGDLEDWGPEFVVYTDAEIADGEPENSTYREIMAANDSTNLYVGFDIKGNNGGLFAHTWVRQAFIDSDDDPTTGFNGNWMSHGYDRLVEFGWGGSAASIYAFAGDNQGAWAWSAVGPIEYGTSANAVEWGILRSSLGVGTNTQVVLEFSVTGGSVTTPTWAHVAESEAKDYVFTIGADLPDSPVFESIAVSGGTVELRVSGMTPRMSTTLDNAAALDPPAWAENQTVESEGTTVDLTTAPSGGATEYFRMTVPVP